MGLFYVFAGVNHFVNPHFYEPLIPDYFPLNRVINYGSGVLEVVLGLGVLTTRFRKASAYAIFVLLILFIPTHIYFIQIGACIKDGLCTPMWVAWVRLVFIHPLLLYWTIFVAKQD